MMSSISRRTAGLIIAAMAIYGCSSLLSKISQLLVDTAIADIAAKGGAAALIESGEAFVLEMDNPDSPLFGSTIDMPSDALPDDVDFALLSIETSDQEDVPGGQHRRTGPPAEIRLRRYDRDTKDFSEKSDITLRTRARVRLPYDRELVSNDAATALVVGHIVTGETELEILENAAVDVTGGFVAGDTATFSPFVAIISNELFANLAPYTGNCIEHIDSDADGTDEQTYDHFVVADRKVEVTSTNPEHESKEFYFYDAQNELTGANVSGTNASIQFIKNSSGQVTQENFDFFADGSIEGITFYNYNNNGQITQATSDGSGHLMYTYDSADRVAMVEDFSSQGTLLGCETVNYQDGFLSTIDDHEQTSCDEIPTETRVYEGCPERIVKSVLLGFPPE